MCFTSAYDRFEFEHVLIAEAYVSLQLIRSQLINTVDQSYFYYPPKSTTAKPTIT
jgi:hypothetical protein